MKRLMSGKDALLMGVAIIAASLVLVLSLASSPMVSLALQTTETPTVEVTATPDGSETPTLVATATTDAGSAPTAVPATASGAMLAPCVEAVAPSTDVTAEATSEATEAIEATADTSATPSVDATVTSAPTSFLGVVVAAVGDCGVRVAEVFADSPAFEAGLAVGDVIVAVNGVPLTELTTSQATRPDGMMNYASLTTAGFFTAIHALPPGTIATLTIQRDGQQLDLTATLGTLAPDSISSDLEGAPGASETPDLSATVEATATP